VPVPLFPAITVEALLAGFRGVGLDAESIAHDAGLSERDLEDPDAQIDGSAIGALWQRAMIQAGREELPTEVGLAVPFGAFGVVDYLVGSAETVEAGLVALRDHFEAIASAIAFEVDSDEGGAWVRVTTAAGEPNHPGLEFSIAVTLARFRAVVDDDWPVDAVELTRAAPAAPTRHAELLRATVTFEHAAARARLSTRALRAPLRGADPALRRTLTHVAKRLAMGREGAPELEMAIRSRLRDLLPQRRADATSVARSLGLSERTLYRRLGALQRTYQNIVDDFRSAEAERLLARGRLPLAELALSLGFADQTAFNHAFRRWKGTSPRAWLAQRASERSR
jgi:AraC-like DNA-binding protein